MGLIADEQVEEDMGVRPWMRVSGLGWIVREIAFKLPVSIFRS